MCCCEINFVHCKYVLLSLVNKKADWPIARQAEVRRESQTEDSRKKKGRGDELVVLRKGTNPHGRA